MFKDEHKEHEHALDVDALQYSFDVLTACSFLLLHFIFIKWLSNVMMSSCKPYTYSRSH